MAVKEAVMGVHKDDGHTEALVDSIVDKHALVDMLGEENFMAPIPAEDITPQEQADMWDEDYWARESERSPY